MCVVSLPSTMINKVETYKENLLRDKKLFLIMVLVLIIIVIISLELNFKVISLKIEDKCGKFINVMSHTIDDENICISRCRAQCNSIDYKYKKIEFKKNDIGCNSCLCYCK